MFWKAIHAVRATMPSSLKWAFKAWIWAALTRRVVSVMVSA